jgi:hypothetical protein
MMNSRKFMFFFLCFPASVQTQDLTGIWRGHFRSSELYQRLLGEDDRYKMEVQIAQKNKLLQAVTYSYKSSFFYGKADADGMEDPQTNKIRLREIKILESKTIGGDVCIMNCQLRYSKLGDEEFLEGTFSSMNTRDSSDCGNGTIFLHKVTVSDFYEEPFLLHREKEIENEKNKTGSKGSAPVKKSPALVGALRKIPANKTSVSTDSTGKSRSVPKKTGNGKAQISTTTPHRTPLSKSTSKSDSSSKRIVPQPNLAKSQISGQPISPGKNDSIGSIAKDPILVPTPGVLIHRSNELVRTITFHTADLELNIYDDGVIDNDTVSVYYDKKLIVSNARLSDKPIVVKLHLDQGSASHELVMVAENEGDIPPNTSLMIVKAGEDRYEVRIVSTVQRNAVLIFKYQKTQE